MIFINVIENQTQTILNKIWELPYIGSDLL
jgi:hypothetical protein